MSDRLPAGWMCTLNERVVASILKRLSTSEQPTGLPQLKKGGVLDSKPSFDICWAAIERGLHILDELLDSSTTHRR